MRTRGKHSHRFGLVTALIVLAMSLVFAASAAAEVRSGSGTDPAEEELLGSLDLVAVSVGYDSTTGTITAQLTTREPPEAGFAPGIAVGLGTLQGGECEAPFAFILGVDSTTPGAAWEFGSSEGPAQIAISGATTSLAAASPVLAGQTFNCAEGITFAREGENLVAVDNTAPIALAGPPPTPPASTAPSTPTPTPPSTPAPAPAPKANLTFPSKSLTLHRKAWKKVKVTITNTGNAAAGNVVVKIGKAPGVAIKPKSGKLKLKSIAAGKSKVASFQAMLTPQAKASSKLTISVASVKGVKASGAVTLEAWKKPAPKKKGKKGKEPAPPATPPLAEKIFYAYKTEVSQSAKLIGYAFIDGEWAYHGIPAEGLPGCTSATGDGGKESAEGCVKYSYDPTTGTVKIGSATGKLNPGGELEIDGETYSATSIPPAGTRLQVEQEYIGYSGFCGLITGCSTWHEHLILAGNGEFVLSRESLTTLGGNGPGETFVAAGSYPADQHGTYAVEKGARIKLSFADGTSKTKTFAYFLNKEGKPDPTIAGLLLGTEYFTFAHDE
jgi:hypothetical protein